VRILKGDNDAANTLISRHLKAAVRIAYSVLGNEDDAQDAAQDAFIKALRNLPHFSGNSAFSTWLYRIVYNSALDIGRKRRRTVQQKVDEDEEEYESEAPQEREEGREPSDKMLRREKIEAVRRCLEKLPEKYAIVIKMKDIEKLSYDQIAEVLGTTRGNVMSRLNYGRIKLKELLESEDLP
jgi:RNA polymerase sigma-70 factor, ECF subfamily